MASFSKFNTTNADLVIGLVSRRSNKFTRALKTVRHNPKHILLSQGTQKEFYEGLGDDANGVIIMSAYHPKAPFKGSLAGMQMNNADFAAEYHITTGNKPDEDVAITFALCQGIDQAVRATGSVDDQTIYWLHARTRRPSKNSTWQFRMG